MKRTKFGKGLSIFLERRRVRPLDDSSYDKPSGLIDVIIASSAQDPSWGLGRSHLDLVEAVEEKIYADHDIPEPPQISRPLLSLQPPRHRSDDDE